MAKPLEVPNGSEDLVKFENLTHLTGYECIPNLHTILKMSMHSTTTRFPKRESLVFRSCFRNFLEMDRKDDHLMAISFSWLI